MMVCTQDTEQHTMSALTTALPAPPAPLAEGAFENSPAGTANRGFSFEAVSINSIESIEINRVTSADMEANAPAGNINLKTKRAFDLRGRRISWSLGTVLNTEEFTLRKTPGPNDTTGYKFKPNYLLSYADTLFNNRLGLYLSLSESNLYNEQYRVDHTYNRTPTATDPRPPRPRRPARSPVCLVAGVARGLLVEPRLVPVAARQAVAVSRYRWWARPPFLPWPERDYLRFRSTLHRGDGGRADAEDVLAWLRWCASRPR